MNELSIGETARRAGVRPSALRYYERLGLLLPAGRINGRRRYAPEVVRELNVIRYLQRAGFSLREIGGLRRGGAAILPSRSLRGAMRAKIRELEAEVERIRSMKADLERGLECACQGLADCAMICPREE